MKNKVSTGVIQKARLSFLSIMCVVLLFGGCGKKQPLTKEEFAEALRNPEKVDVFSPEKEPLTEATYASGMKESMECSIMPDLIAMGSFGYGNFRVYDNREEAHKAFAEGLEYWISVYETDIKNHPYLVGVSVKLNETAEDHDILLLQSEYAYIRMSRVENTFMTIRIANDVEKWTEVFEEAFAGTGY